MAGGLVLDIEGRHQDPRPNTSTMPLFQSVTDLAADAEILRRRRYGVIEVADGRLLRILLRPFPKIASAPEVVMLGGWRHAHRRGDRILLYYNQPMRFSNFLVLRSAVSARQTSMKSLCRALAVLDEIARLKQSDALLCDVANWRISTALMGRWGWGPHCPARWHRHFIKRFYGDFPKGLVIGD
jgi:hypothetical protein